jgi:hypothetical protein
VQLGRCVSIAFLRSAEHGTLARSVCSFGTLMTINTPHQRGAPKRFSIPLERIESLRPALRFRVPLQEGAHELEILRQKAGNTPRVPL